MYNAIGRKTLTSMYYVELKRRIETECISSDE